MEKFYLDATPEAGLEFYRRQNTGKFFTLNLLQFKETADYSLSPQLSPLTPITGEEAYRTYINNVLPLFKKIGSEIIFYGNGGKFLIGPDHEQWNAVLLDCHQGVQAFIDFAKSKEYLNIVGHRTAALRDSRLLPIDENLSFKQ